MASPDAARTPSLEETLSALQQTARARQVAQNQYRYAQRAQRRLIDLYSATPADPVRAGQLAELQSRLLTLRNQWHFDAPTHKDRKP